MSSEAVTWAKAQRCPSARAKAVLVCLASWANPDGESWVPLSIMLIETELGVERTVQRGLADLKRAGLIQLTGKPKVHQGKVLPIYQLALDQGPSNTRARLAADQKASTEGCLGVTLVSPQDEPGVTPVSPQESRGDTGVTARGDTSVTQSRSKREEEEREGAREAAWRSGFEALKSACHPLMMANCDQAAAFQAFVDLAVAGAPVDQLADCARRMAAHPTTRKRDYAPIGLDRWLRGGRWWAWTVEAMARAEGGATGSAPPAVPAAFLGPPGLRVALVRRSGDEKAIEGTLDRCAWDEASQTITPRTGYAHGKLKDWMRGLAEAEGITLAEPAKAGV